MKSEPRSEPRPGCLAQELSGDSGIWVALERRTGSCLGISGLAAKIAACLFVICVIRPLIRPHVGSPSSWLCSAPGSTRKGKVAICFPVWPLGQVASGARCPQPSGACFAFYLWCVSPSLHPPSTPSGAETRRVPGRWSWLAWQPWPRGSFPGRVEAELCLQVQESPRHLLSPVVSQTQEAGPEAGPSCPHALAVASLRDRGGSPTLRY